MRVIPFVLTALLLLSACGGLRSPEPGGTVFLEWRFEEGSRNRGDEPWSDAFVVLTGAQERELYLGDFLGCAGDPWVVPEGSLSTVQCWFAGSGDELSVFRTADDELRVLHRFILEPDPESDVFEMYTDFQEIGTFQVPRGSVIEVLGMRIVERR